MTVEEVRVIDLGARLEEARTLGAWVLLVLPPQLVNRTTARRP
jgi:hypothetical protein